MSGQDGLFDEPPQPPRICPGCDKPEPLDWCWDGRDDGCPLGYPPRYPSEQAHTRRGDPVTSHEAAASIESEAIRASQQAVLECFAHFGPMYDEELVQKYGWTYLSRGWPSQSPSGLRSRRSELVKRHGKLRDSGMKVFPPGKTRRAIVWELAR